MVEFVEVQSAQIVLPRQDIRKAHAPTYTHVHKALMKYSYAK